MNLFGEFKKIFPDAPLQVGSVLSVDGPIATVQLPGGGVLKARGEAAAGQQVFVRDGVIESAAPAMPLVIISI